MNVTIALPSLHTSHRSRRCPLPIVPPSHTAPGSPAGWRSSLSHSTQRILLHVRNGEDNLGKFSGLRKLLEISSWIWDPYPLSENSQIISNVFGCIFSETLYSQSLVTYYWQETQAMFNKSSDGSYTAIKFGIHIGDVKQDCCISIHCSCTGNTVASH